MTKVNTHAARMTTILLVAKATRNNENALESIKAQRTTIEKEADKLVSSIVTTGAIEEINELKSILTESFEAMTADDVIFCSADVKTPSGQSRRKGQILAAARKFHRSFNNLQFGGQPLAVTLTGYAPFMTKERKVKVEMTIADKIAKLFDGTDSQLLSDVNKAYGKYEERKAKRTAERVTVIEEDRAKEQAASQAANQQVAAGMKIEELETALLAKKGKAQKAA